MGQIGESLAKARLKKELSLLDAENDTKIRVKYLAALEAEDFAVIPGRVYVVGFLRTYAKYLGLDDQSLVSLYQGQNEIASPHHEEALPSALPDKKDRKIKKAVRINKSNGRFALTMAILALLLLSAAVYYFNALNRAPADPVQTGTPAVTDENPAPVAAPAETAVPVETTVPEVTVPDTTAEEIVVAVKINSDSCWLAVTIDGKADFHGLVYAGKSKTFRGQESVKIKFGNAGAAAVTFLGETIDPVGGQGQVITKEFKINQ